MSLKPTYKNDPAGGRPVVKVRGKTTGKWRLRGRKAEEAKLVRLSCYLRVLSWRSYKNFAAEINEKACGGKEVWTPHDLASLDGGIDLFTPEEVEPLAQIYDIPAEAVLVWMDPRKVVLVLAEAALAGRCAPDSPDIILRPPPVDVSGYEKTLEDMRAWVDKAPYDEMLAYWRAADPEDPLVNGELGQYFIKVLTEKKKACVVTQETRGSQRIKNQIREDE